MSRSLNRNAYVRRSPLKFSHLQFDTAVKRTWRNRLDFLTNICRIHRRSLVPQRNTGCRARGLARRFTEVEFRSGPRKSQGFGNGDGQAVWQFATRQNIPHARRERLRLLWPTRAAIWFRIDLLSHPAKRRPTRAPWKGPQALGKQTGGDPLHRCDQHCLVPRHHLAARCRPWPLLLQLTLTTIRGRCIYDLGGCDALRSSIAKRDPVELGNRALTRNGIAETERKGAP